MKKSLKKGLPGGPNEKLFSKEGYRSTSSDVNNLFNIIPSGNITMKEKDGTPLKKGPLLGIDNLGNSQLMLPGADYQFPGNVVQEVPLAKKGGPFQNSNIYATNKLFAINPLFKKRKKGKKARGIYNPKAKYTYDEGGETNCPLGYMWNGIECILNPFETRPSQRAAVYMDKDGTYKMDPVYQQFSQQKFDVAESNRKAQEFNKMYVQSKNYKRLLKKQGYTPEEIEDRINSVMNINDFRYIDQGQSWVGADENTGKEFISYNVTDPGDWPGFDQIAAHEWGHVGVDSGASPLKQKEKEEFINRINKEQAGVTGNPDDLVHDMEPQENRADLVQLKLQLQESGIFDSTKRKRFTKKDLNKYKEAMKSSERNWDNMWNRMFRLYDDDSIIYLMNNVAQNNSNEDVQVAKYGFELDLTEDEIQKYVKGGYIVEDISVPLLSRMQLAGEVPDSTYTPIDPNFLAENPDTYSKIVNKPEVTSERQGSDIGKLRAEFREKNPMDTFLDEKKRQYLKKNKGLNKAAGVTMENFPEDVLQNFMNEYDYKTNTYAVNKLGKKEGWNPKRRGEWVDELTPGERDAVAESKYGSKLQPSYWSRSLAGVQELGNTLLPGQPLQFNIPGLTKKEQKEIRESKLGALETLAPMDIPGAAITNLVKNTGLSTGSDYKNLPGVLSGEKMSNVSDMEAMALNPLTYAGLEALPELGINLAKGIGRGTLNLGKGLAKGIAGSEYTAGYNKLNSGLNTLGQKKALLNKKLVETAGKLPDSLIERRLSQFTDTNPRRRIIGSTKELEQKLKVDLYRLNKLKKQHPNLDFDNPALRGEMFTHKENIEKLPDILKTIDQNQKSAESLAKYVKKDFDNKIDFVRNSGNSVLKNIVDESPQYLDEVYAHLKNPKKTDEQFVNDLTIQSNTYTRFMKNPLDDSEYLNAVRGSNIDNYGYSMDVEGIRPSDWYGEYGYRIQPTIDRAMEIFQTPLAEKWGKRIPTFQGDVKMVPGMHTGLPENVENALRIRNERINRNIVKSYEGEEMTHSIPMDYRFKNLIRENLPEEFVQSKYYRIPKHQVFNSPKYGQSLEGFETIPLGKLELPEIYTGYKNNEDYARFFEDTGKGFKEGGVVSNLTKKEIDKLIKQGYIIEEID